YDLDVRPCPLCAAARFPHEAALPPLAYAPDEFQVDVIRDRYVRKARAGNFAGSTSGGLGTGRPPRFGEVREASVNLSEPGRADIQRVFPPVLLAFRRRELGVL